MTRAPAILSTILLLATVAAPAQEYAGAEACKDCHEVIYESWKDSKHARALERLAQAERRDSPCVACHTTGATEQVASGTRMPGVQCESCHGPATAHVAGAAENPPATAALARISAATCQRCHSPESPHFKYFSYRLMKDFIHKKG